MLLFILFGLAAPLKAQERAVTVFAAASLQDVLAEIASDFPTDVTLTFSGSGAIARQVQAGAPADLVILADPLWAGWLADRGYGFDPFDIAANRLVVISQAGTPPLESADALAERLANDRLAIGQRQAVPAGRYAEEWLRATGLWEKLAAQLAETDNVRAAAALVARGQAPYGIVYATDAQADPAVTVVWEISSEYHSPIRYPALITGPGGERILKYLTGRRAIDIFRAHGFIAPAP
jgi:molybdate transport system substrate-binding protein